MLAIGLRVARPTDPSGVAMRALLTVLTLMMALYVVLGRLPSAWTALFAEAPAIYRPAALVGLGLVVLAFRPFAYALLPGSVIVAWRRVRLRVRGRPTVVAITEIADVVVDRRPQPTGEVMVLVMHDGRELDLCPLHWPGAGDVYIGLRRRIGWRRAQGPAPVRDPAAT